MEIGPRNLTPDCLHAQASTISANISLLGEGGPVSNYDNVKRHSVCMNVLLISYYHITGSSVTWHVTMPANQQILNNKIQGDQLLWHATIHQACDVCTWIVWFFLWWTSCHMLWISSCKDALVDLAPTMECICGRHPTYSSPHYWFQDESLLWIASHQKNSCCAAYILIKALCWPLGTLCHYTRQNSVVSSLCVEGVVTQQLLHV